MGENVIHVRRIQVGQWRAGAAGKHGAGDIRKHLRMKGFCSCHLRVPQGVSKKNFGWFRNDGRLGQGGVDSVVGETSSVTTGGPEGRTVVGDYGE